MWSIRKRKTEGTKQQQTHRTQEWTNSYQRERDWGGWVAREGEGGKGGIMISTYNVVGGGCGVGSKTQIRQVVTL